MILTGYHYRTKLSLEQYSEVDFKRFRPAASFEAFPVWMDYIRKNFPNEEVLFFNGESPISFEEGAKAAGIKKYDIYLPEFNTRNPYNDKLQYHLINLPKTASNYSFQAVQKQRVEALKFAYLYEEDFLWIDTDCFINSDILSKLRHADIAANVIDNQFQCIDGHFIYISSERLHEWDKYFNVIDFLEGILNGLEDTKQGYKSALLFEGGMYKLFGYGNMLEIKNINIAHASSYNNFLKWLQLNRLDTDNYKNLMSLLYNVNLEKLKGYLMEFEDTFEVEKYF